MADLRIGQVLASSPMGSDDAWPDVAVRDLIEDLGEEDIERGFEIGVYNSRGVFSRSLTEGGEQERQLSKRYKGYADALNDAWPRTAAIRTLATNIHLDVPEPEFKFACTGPDAERNAAVALATFCASQDTRSVYSPKYLVGWSSRNFPFYAFSEDRRKVRPPWPSTTA